MPSLSATGRFFSRCPVTKATALQNFVVSRRAGMSWPVVSEPMPTRANPSFLAGGAAEPAASGEVWARRELASAAPAATAAVLARKVRRDILEVDIVGSCAGG